MMQGKGAMDPIYAGFRYHYYFFNKIILVFLKLFSRFYVLFYLNPIPAGGGSLEPPSPLTFFDISNLHIRLKAGLLYQLHESSGKLP